MGIVNSYFPVEKVRNYLSRKKLYGFEYLMASLFGVVTPFYSCSSVPLFIGFVKGGIPLGVTFSFLVTSPLVNEVAIGLFVGLFGLKTTLIYVVSGVLLGTVSGMLVTFSGLATSSAAQPIDKISVGISEALITTQAGLLIAMISTTLLAPVIMPTTAIIRTNQL